MEGWVKIHRQIIETEIWDTMEPFDTRSAWVDLILMVNHQEGVVLNGAKIAARIPAGSTLTSIRKLAERWHWSKSKTQNYIRTLIDLGMVHTKRTSRGTLLTLVKYRDYQGRRDTKWDTDKDTDWDTDRDTGRPQTRMNKNDKEVKNARTRDDRRAPTLAEKLEAIRRRGEELDRKEAGHDDGKGNG